MTKTARVFHIAAGICILMTSAIMYAFPDMGYLFAVWILGFVLLVKGIRQFIYYISMGIHMVGGEMILYKALITMDLGVFALTIHGTGQRYIMFYFAFYYMFEGLISCFRAMEAKRYEAGSWKMNLAGGVFQIAISVICLVHNNSESMMLKILCFALVVSGITRITMALRKSAIIYIP